MSKAKRLNLTESSYRVNRCSEVKRKSNLAKQAWRYWKYDNLSKIRDSELRSLISGKKLILTEHDVNYFNEASELIKSFYEEVNAVKKLLVEAGSIEGFIKGFNDFYNEGPNGLVLTEEIKRSVNRATSLSETRTNLLDYLNDLELVLCLSNNGRRIINEYALLVNDRIYSDELKKQDVIWAESKAVKLAQELVELKRDEVIKGYAVKCAEGMEGVKKLEHLLSDNLLSLRLKLSFNLLSLTDFLAKEKRLRSYYGNLIAEKKKNYESAFIELFNTENHSITSRVMSKWYDEVNKKLKLIYQGELERVKKALLN